MRKTGLVVLVAALAGLACPQAFVSARAQTGQGRGSGLILGQVVDADGGTPVAGAIVTLNGAPATPPLAELVVIQPALPLSGRRALTDGNGRFLFRDVPAGHYTLPASVAGYVPGVFGQDRPLGPPVSIDLADGQRIGGVTVRLWRYGVIAGTLVDEHGDPVAGVGIRCLVRQTAGGHPRFELAGSLTSANTDDRGTYRVPNLVPGDYICGTLADEATMPMSAVSVVTSRRRTAADAAAYRTLENSGGAAVDPTGIREGEFVLRPYGIALTRGLLPPAPAADGRMLMYPTIFYPGSLTTTQATIIALKSGQERNGINLQLRLVPAVRVSGTVTGPDGAGGNLAVKLLPSTAGDFVSEGAADAASTVTATNGAFTFLGIPAGQYVLRIRMFPRPVAPTPGSAIEGAPAAAVELGLLAPGAGIGRGGPPPMPPDEPTLWATLPVTVGDSDLTDLAVTLHPGAKMTGRLEFDGTKPPPTPEQIQRVTIRLQSAEGRTSSPIPADGHATSDGAFRTAGYPAGRYIASVLATTLPPGWSLRSIVADGKDISVDPIEISNEDITGVVISCTDRTTTLSGAVTTGSGPDAKAVVIAFPADSVAWKDIGVVARRYRAERTTKTGTFTMTGLPPGEYFVAAIASDAGADPQDPRFLETLVPTATRVSLADGDQKAVSLRRR